MRSSPVCARGYLHSSINVAINDVVSELNRIKLSGLISDYAIGDAVAAQAYSDNILLSAAGQFSFYLPALRSMTRR